MNYINTINKHTYIIIKAILSESVLMYVLVFNPCRLFDDFCKSILWIVALGPNELPLYPSIQSTAIVARNVFPVPLLLIFCPAYSKVEIKSAYIFIQK